MSSSLWKALPLAAALAGGCTTGSEAAPAPADDGGAWMEGAIVTVTRDAGRETVTLTDPESGFSQVMSDEPLTPGAVETDDTGPVAVAIAAPLSR